MQRFIAVILVLLICIGVGVSNAAPPPLSHEQTEKPISVILEGYPDNIYGAPFYEQGTGSKMQAGNNWVFDNAPICTEFYVIGYEPENRLPLYPVEYSTDGATWQQTEPAEQPSGVNGNYVAYADNNAYDSLLTGQAYWPNWARFIVPEGTERVLLRSTGAGVQTAVANKETCLEAACHP